MLRNRASCLNTVFTFYGARTALCGVGRAACGSGMNRHLCAGGSACGLGVVEGLLACQCHDGGWSSLAGTGLADAERQLFRLLWGLLARTPAKSLLPLSH